MKYNLIDSGSGLKLEQIDDTTICRPSSQAIWEKENPKLWNKIDYTYNNNWSKQFEKKVEILPNIKIIIRSRNNGQIGIFPEHLSYFKDLEDEIRRINKKRVRVLNLFAYTGLASLFCLKNKCEVTHVDIAKSCLDWFSDNLKLNNLNCSIIKEDAMKYLEKLNKREEKFDIIIADPPSFSRVSKNSSWQLDDIFQKLIKNLTDCIQKEDSAIFFTSHSNQFNPLIVQNCFHKYLNGKGRYIFDFLKIGQNDICIPAGYLNKISM